MKREMQWQSAYHMATEFKESYILPHCMEATIAGSIRRQKAKVGDVEIVCRPDGDELLNQLEHLWKQGIIEPEMKRGKPYVWIDRPQPRQVKFIWQGVPFDVYMVLEDRRQWFGYHLVLRTGPSEANKLMVHPNFKPLVIKFQDGMVFEMGNPVAVPEEKDLFELCNMNFVSPKFRRVEVYRRARQDWLSQRKELQS